MQNNKEIKSLSHIALQAVPRALSLLDRNPFSESYGCFDKYYWHFKTRDFPSAPFQMGVEFLARLWQCPQKPWFKNPQLLQLIKASLAYTVKIQHKDGSFDEWYPNERGWAGPTSYVINALCAAYTITEECLEDSLKNSLQKSFLKAADFLLQRDEGDILSNHFALFLLFLHRVHQITGDQKLKTQLESHLEKFLSHTSKEGWSLEYNGADFGYELATLGFLGRIHKQFPHPPLESYAKKSFQFLSWFFYPDGSFGGGIGSRETVHLYPYAVKYWSRTIPTAKSILHHLTELKSFQKLTSLDQDDHYLFYRLSEYLEYDSLHTEERELLQTESMPLPEQKQAPKTITDFSEKETASFDVSSSDSGVTSANLNFKILSATPEKSGILNKPSNPTGISITNILPFKQEGEFQKYFPESGFFVKKTKSLYFVSNLKKGGCFQMYSIPKRKCVLKNYGWVAKLKNKKMRTAFWISENSPQIKITENEISVSGHSSFFQQKYFTPLKLILFRLITICFGWNAMGAAYLKRLIRKVLITNPDLFSYNIKPVLQKIHKSIWVKFYNLFAPASTGRQNSHKIGNLNKTPRFKTDHNLQTNTVQNNTLTKPNYYKRSIFFTNDTIETLDILFPGSAEQIFYGGGFSLRYVPQSNYFQNCDLIQETGASVFKGPFEKKAVFIKQIYDLKDFSIKVDLCAESPDTFNSKKTAPLQ